MEQKGDKACMDKLSGHSGLFHDSLLDAEELLKLTAKQSALPYSGGIKGISIEDTNTELTEIFYEELSSVLSDERVCKQNSLSVGTWETEKKMIRVDQICGSHWQKFGVVLNKVMFASPEEGLFLVEQGLLQVYCDGMPLSFQECWMLLTMHMPSIEHYMVYAHLCRLGFAVKRRPRTNYKQREDRSEVESSSNSLKRSFSQRNYDVRNEEVSRIDDSKISCLDGTYADQFGLREEKPSRSYRDVEDTSTSASEKGPVTAGHDECNETDPNQLVKMSNEGQRCQAKPLKDPLQTHWHLKEITPLVSPSDAKTTDAVLSKLQIIKARHIGHTTSTDDGTELESALHVYQKTPGFKKSDPGLADYSVSVCKYTEPPPNHNELEASIRNTGSVPLKFAVCNRGTTTFYSMMNVDVSRALCLNKN